MFFIYIYIYIYIFIYYISSSASGQYAANSVFWCSDWLPERARWSDTARPGLPVSFPQIKFRQSSSECAKVFSNHNKEILINNNNITPQNECNCRKKTNAHALDNKCPITSVIYKANVTSDNDNTGNNYIGLRERNIQTTIYAT